MNNINVQTWDKVYSEGRSLLIWPDEVVVSTLNKYKNRFKKAKGLDIACGAGRHTILMAQMGVESIGIDSSSSSIEFARQRAESMHLNNVTFINGLIQEIELEEEKFDVIIAWGLIHYLDIQQQTKLINKIKCSLKPNGIFIGTFRSVEDTRKKHGTLIENNKYLVDYFDPGTNTAKQTVMSFWDESGVTNTLACFKEVKIGHRVVEPIGKLGLKTAHWLVEATK